MDTNDSFAEEGISYLREIEIRYKKHKVKRALAEKSLANAQQVYELFCDLQNETKEKMIILSLDAKMKILCFEVVALGSVRTKARGVV